MTGLAEGKVARFLGNQLPAKQRARIWAINRTFPGWLAAQFHSCASIPPSVRSDHRPALFVSQRDHWIDA